MKKPTRDTQPRTQVLSRRDLVRVIGGRNAGPVDGWKGELGSTTTTTTTTTK